MIQTILGMENCEILDSTFSTTKHNKPKLYLDLVGIKEKSGEYSYKYQISTPISNAKSVKEKLEKVLGISYDESKETKSIEGVSYTVTPDEIKTLIKLTSHIEKKNIEEIKINLKAAYKSDVVNLPDALNVNYDSLEEIIAEYTMSVSQPTSHVNPLNLSSHLSPRNSDKETPNPYLNTQNKDINSPGDSNHQLSPNSSDEDMQTTPPPESNETIADLKAENKILKQKNENLETDNNSDEELSIIRKPINFYDNIMAVPSKSLNPTSSRFQPLGSSPQDTPSSVATDDVESDEMSSTPNSIEELQSKSSSASQDLLSSSSSEEELIFNRNILPTDNESPRKSSSINTNKRKHSASENEELTLSDSEDEALNSSVKKQLSKKLKVSNFDEVMPILFDLVKNLKFSNLTRVEKENLTNLLLQEELNVNGKYN